MQRVEAQGQPFLEPTYAQKIQNLRLEKQLEFLKSLNRTYHILDKSHVIIDSILYDNLALHVHIPREYPFVEPQYAVSSEPNKKWVISEVIQQWSPKLKIFEVIQLLAQRINQKHQIQLKASRFILLRAFFNKKSIPLIIIIAILLRILLGLGSYSGMGDFPNLGDFQAHRNWMSITVNRPIDSWYQEYDQQPWWRIDYPPVSAYFSYILGLIYKQIEPSALNLQRGYQSQSLKAYMRFTVLLIDLVFLFPPLIMLAKQFNRNTTSLILFLTLLKPDVILIDHGHFQYNSLILGLILISVYFLLKGKYSQACITYTIAIHTKQMAVYYSLGFLGALIGFSYRDLRHSKVKFLGQLIKYGLIVILVSLIIWIPWLNNTQHFYSVIHAIFPVHRGLYQLKVANFWCISDIIFKWETHFSKPMLVFFCTITSLLASLPSFISLILNPTRKTITIGFAIISMSFFMFSYHVHEKSILLPLLMVPFIGQYLGGWLAHDIIIAGCVGMFHLLKEDKQQIGYFAIMILFYIYSTSYVLFKGDSKTETQSTLELHWFIYEKKWMRMLIMGVLLTLHINQKLISAPESLPYLHHLLFALFSFTFNAYFLIIGNLWQLELIYKGMNIRPIAL